ncbi:MAG: hypothetical protein RIT03_1033 [Bacteroidota bacterium]|jgi:hypothetical protein
MKKIGISLLFVTLLSLVVYNGVGCYLLDSFQQEQAWIRSVEQKDANYFKEIRLNASVYSFVEDTDMEFINENMVINNKVYHVFKRQIKDNVIHLYYLENSKQNLLKYQLNRLVDSDDLAAVPSSKSPLEKVFKTFAKDYIPSTNSPILEVNFCFNSTKKLPCGTAGNLHSGFAGQLFSPPKLA